MPGTLTNLLKSVQKQLSVRTLIIFSKNEISKQLVNLFNLSFMTGVSPLICKTANVVPVSKKD